MGLKHVSCSETRASDEGAEENTGERGGDRENDIPRVKKERIPGHHGRRGIRQEVSLFPIVKEGTVDPEKAGRAAL